MLCVGKGQYGYLTAMKLTTLLLLLLPLLLQAQQFVPRAPGEPVVALWVVKDPKADRYRLQHQAVAHAPGRMVTVFAYPAANGERWQIVHISSYEDYPQARACLEALAADTSLTPRPSEPDCQLMFITHQNFQTAIRRRKLEDYCAYFVQIKEGNY